jgi:ribosome-associated protein
MPLSIIPAGRSNSFLENLLEAAVTGAEEKQSLDTVVLDVSALNESLDAYVVCVGRTDRQVRAIADEVERLVELAGCGKPLRVEGLTAGEWVALDYGDVIVHVFDELARDYYDLEHLWSTAPATRRSVQR